MKNLLISIGGCGNTLLDTWLDINDKYDSLFINSNAKEMINLNHTNNNNMITLVGGGAGKDREVAKTNFHNDEGKIYEYFFDNVNLYDTYTIITSADGGTGSGTTPEFCKILRGIVNESELTDVDINIIAVIPKLNERIMNLENTLSFYNDILKLSNNNIINSYIFINNEKCQDNNMEDFNRKAIDLIDRSLEINNSAIDERDIKIINSVKGYKVILELDENIQDINQAISEARHNSPFIIPSQLYCSHILASVTDNFNKEEVVSRFTVSKSHKEEYNDEGNNLIVLGGCQKVNGYMNMVKSALESLRKDFESKFEEEEFVFNYPKKAEKTVEIQSKNEENAQKTNKKLSKRELRNRINNKLKNNI